MNETSAFDPQAFLDAQTTEAASRRMPLPIENPVAGDGLYTGVIGEPSLRPWQGKKDPTKSGLALDFTVTIDVPQALQDALKCGPQVSLRESIMLDMTPDGKGLDWGPGKNRRAGIYREATGLNVAGQPFSFRMLQGRPVKVKIAHEVYNGDILDKVATVLKFA